MSQDRDRIDLLLERGALTREQLAECEAESARAGGPADVLHLLLAKGYVDRAELDALAAETATSVEANEEPTVAADAETRRTVERPPRDRIGGFELQSVLGAGGMGMVCRAVDPRLSRTVAVKLVKVGASGIVRERVLREARTAGRLRHPGIVQVHEVGEEDGVVFIAMDCIEGRSLREWIEAQGERRDLREAARLVKEVALAVEFAHSAGVVHRDLKPDNILMDAQSRPYVGDFGLAKELGGETMLTQSGMVMGTPAYMAPEQAEGRLSDIGPATDLYALGGVLYHALTGRTPFDAASIPEILYKVVHEEPLPPTRLNDRVPRDLETICLKCLQKEPARRYASAAALAEDLDRFLAGEAILAHPPSLAWRIRRQIARRKGAFALAALLVLAVGLGVAAMSGKRDAERRLEDERALLACTEEVESIVYVLETWGRRKEDRDAGPEGMGRQAQRAEELLARARGLLPDHPAYLVAHARLALATGRDEEALSLLDRARGHGGEALRSYPLVRGQALLARYSQVRPNPEVYLASESGNAEPILLMEPPPPESPETARLAEEARRELERYLSLGAVDPHGRRSKVALAYLTGEYARVEGVYQAQVEEDAALRWDGEAAHLVARSLYLSAFARGREDRRAALTRALEMLRAISPGPGNARRYHLLLGEVLMALGRHQEAVDAMSLGLDALPGDRSLLLERARAMSALGRWKSLRAEPADADLEAAARAFREVLERSPGDAGAVNGLANALLDRGADEKERGKDPSAAYEEGLRVVEGALARTARPDPALLGNRGCLQLGMGMWVDARGEDPTVWLRAAADSFRDGLSGGARGGRALDGLGLALGELGWIRMRAGEDPTADFREALSAFDEALSGTPSDAFASAHRALVLWRLGDWSWNKRRDDRGNWEAALASAKRASEANPRYYLPWTITGGVRLSRAQSRREDAEAEYALARKAYEESIALYPRDPSALGNLGVALSALGDCKSRRGEEGGELYLDAVRRYDEALAIGPPEGRWHRQRAYALEILGRPKEAVRGYEEALRLDPKDATARKRLDAILAEQAERAPAIDAMRVAAARAADACAAGDRRRERDEWTRGLDAWGERQVVSYEEQVLLVDAHLGRASACAALAAKGAESAPLRDEAFHHLGRAVDFGFSDLEGIEGRTDLVVLHDDPRWVKLLARLQK